MGDHDDVFVKVVELEQEIIRLKETIAKKRDSMTDFDKTIAFFDDVGISYISDTYDYKFVIPDWENDKRVSRDYAAYVAFKFDIESEALLKVGVFE